MRIRFEAEDGKFLITRLELLRVEGRGAINASAVRELPLAPVFKAIRARLVTAFAIIEQLEGREVDVPVATVAEATPTPAAEAEPRRPQSIVDEPAAVAAEPAGNAAAPEWPELDDPVWDPPAAPRDLDDFLRPSEVPPPRPITRPAGRHLASDQSDLEQRRAERTANLDERPERPPYAAGGI
jgi:hypothetical protein